MKPNDSGSNAPTKWEPLAYLIQVNLTPDQSVDDRDNFTAQPREASSVSVRFVRQSHDAILPLRQRRCRTLYSEYSVRTLYGVRRRCCMQTVRHQRCLRGKIAS